MAANLDFPITRQMIESFDEAFVARRKRTTVPFDYKREYSFDIGGCLRSITGPLVEEQERRIRDLLGRWVSELEPVLVYERGIFGDDRLIGLGIADDPTGTIAVRV